MTNSRAITACKWAGLLLATTALGAGLATAQVVSPATPQQQKVWLVSAESNETALKGVAPEADYLLGLAIVEGHLVAANALYAQGLADEAIGLSYQPEPELMDEVRAALAAQGQEDFTPAMQVFSEIIEGGAAATEAQAALLAFQAAVDAAIKADVRSAKTLFVVTIAVLQTAAAEYAGSIKDGTVTDVIAYHQAQAYVDVARKMISIAGGDAKLDALLARTVAAMDPAAEAFGISNGTFIANDPAILLAVAARVELIGSQLR
jgi:hypothetical protein